MRTSFYQNFRRTTRLVWLLLLWLTLLLFATRIFSIAALAEPQQLEGRMHELLHGMIIGLRFDLKVAALGLTPVLLMGLLAGCSPRAARVFHSGAPYYAGLLAFLIHAVAISNHYYFETYDNHFDVFVFGLADDQTSAVISSIWSDYPVTRTAVACLALGWVTLRLTRRSIGSRETLVYPPVRRWFVPLLALALLLPFAALARGSVGALTLRRNHAQVSGYDLINKLTPNGFIALEWAYSDLLRDSEFSPIDREDLLALSERFGQWDVWQQSLENDYLARNPPHVVLALMEAMGTNVLVEDAPPDNDLLGEARRHFEHDFLFKRFISGTNATIDTLAMMLFHSNLPTISHTLAQDAVIHGSAVWPYDQAGYHTVFITAGSGSWRNLARYLPTQGFDEVLDEYSIKLEFPQAAREAHVWGVPDEYAFKLASKVLAEASQPTFIMIMTVSNHSPYAAPADYDPRPVEVSERLGRGFPDRASCREMLTTYQYAANALGEFITAIKDSPLADKTVIAATGDHRVRRLENDGPEELAIKHAVPFYLGVPPEVLAATSHRYDPRRVGSHKDIFPTLYACSLSGARYTSLGGRNLLAETDADSAAFGYHDLVLVTPRGLVRSSQPDLLHPWLSDDSLEVASEPVPNDDPTCHRDYSRWQTLYINQQVAGEIAP